MTRGPDLSAWYVSLESIEFWELSGLHSWKYIYLLGLSLASGWTEQRSSLSFFSAVLP